MATAAIIAGLDMSEWAGVTLFSRNGTDVAAPALGTLHDGGHYPDVVAMLNGWASYRNATSALDAQWSGTGTVRYGIDSDGMLYVERLGGVGTFTVTPGTSNPWGWPAGTTTSSSVGGNQRVTATSPWTRGQFIADTDAQYTIVEGFVSETVPVVPTVAQCLPVYLNGQTTADADEVTETLEKWDNAALDAATKRIKWGIDDTGRVFSSWPSGPSWAISWSSTTFRSALGFTGSESAVLTNGVYVLTATHAPVGLLLCRSGIAQMDPRRVHYGTALDLVDGTVRGRSVSTVREVDLSVSLRSAMAVVDSDAAYTDEAEIWLHRVSPYLFPGARVTIVPRLGDPRMGWSLPEQLANGVTSPGLESSVYNGRSAGVAGRRRGYVAADAERATTLTFAEGQPRKWTRLGLRVRLLDG